MSAAMNASLSTTGTADGVVEAYSADLLELTFLVVLSCFLYTQTRDYAPPSKPPATRSRHFECISLCMAVTLAFHVRPAMLAFALLISLAYIVTKNPKTQQVKAKSVKGTSTLSPRKGPVASQHKKSAARGQSAPQAGSSAVVTCNIAARCESKPSDTNGQISEVLKCLKPTTVDEVLAKKLEDMARECISPVVPEAHVEAVAFGNLSLLADCGAQPEIELVVTCDPEVLVTRLTEYFRKCPGPRDISLKSLSEPSLLIKTATKALSEQLAFVRYWRTQLNSPECKTVHLVPKELGLFEHPLYLHFSVNSPYPLRMNRLLSQEQQRCADLVMLVRYWVRERAVSNVGRGQFSQYAWATLALHFCRYEMAVGEENIFELFHAFVRSYAALFKRDAAPSICFEGGADRRPETNEFPYIEDSQEPGHDLSVMTDAEGMERVNEELQRACRILDGDSDNVIAKLLERWIKPKP